MSFQAFMFRLMAGRSDKKRDAAIPLPEGVTEHRDLSYGPYGKWSLLDVYYPQGTEGSLPTIVSIHGGGYVYGEKELYRRYGMDMARRGFAFVNFNYPLAPEMKFPTPLAETNRVLHWAAEHAEQYHLDPENLILLGDSAGAQLTSQYAAIHTNPEYAALFGFAPAPVQIKAVGLYCGMYDLSAWTVDSSKGLAADYLPKGYTDDGKLKVLEAIGSNYPPAFIMTGSHDFLRQNAQPMYEFLTGKGIPCFCRCYGAEDNKKIGHVFHVNILLPEAVQCNDDAAEFFRKHIG